MPREIRPWYRPRINPFSVLWIFISGGAIAGSIEIMRRGYYNGLWLFGIGALVLVWTLQISWRERRRWIYETHKGRKIRVRRHFRDEYFVSINGRSARVYAEMLTGNGVAISFEGIRTWETGIAPMTQEERVDILDILLEDLEASGIRAEFFDTELPDTPQVRAALQRLKDGGEVTLIPQP